MLLQALVACAGVTLRAVATAMAIPLRGGRIVAEGVWDARGTLGVDKTAPVGLTEIALRFDLDSDAEPAKIERLVATTERFCVIFQTLRHPPELRMTPAAAQEIDHATATVRALAPGRPRRLAAAVAGLPGVLQGGHSGRDFARHLGADAGPG